MVSVVIPAHNEEKTVAEVVRVALLAEHVDEVLVVDDGSRDGTAERAAGAGAQVVRLSRRGGKGGALAAGVAASRGDILVFLDADLVSLRPEHVEALLAPVLTGAAEMAVGLFSGGAWWTDLAHRAAPGLTGQRALRRALLPENLAGLGYAVESVLEERARHGKWRVRRVVLSGVTHLTKEEKRGVLLGVWSRLRMYGEITRYRARARLRQPAHLLSGRALRLLVLLSLLGLVWFQGRDVLWARAESSSLPGLQLGTRILVLSPHPDDESLGAGGLIATARQGGKEVRIVWMTSGDGFRRGARVWYGRAARADDMIAYGRLRREEAVRAAGRLGVPADRLAFLGYPDGGLAKLWWDHWSGQSPYTSSFTGLSAAGPDSVTPKAPYAGEAILNDLRRILEDYRPSDIFVTDAADSNSDHWATQAFLLAALSEVENRHDGYNPRVYGYLIHHRAWEVLPVVLSRKPLLPPRKLLQAATEEKAWHVLPLDQESLAEKEKALREYQTQQEAMGTFMQNFLRPNEVFRAVKATHINVSGSAGPGEDFLTDAQEEVAAGKLGRGGVPSSLAVASSPHGLRLTLAMQGRLARGLGYRVGVYRLPASGQGGVERHVLRLKAENGRLIVTEEPPALAGTAPVVEQRATGIDLDIPLGLSPGDAVLIGVEVQAGFPRLNRTPWGLWLVDDGQVAARSP